MASSIQYIQDPGLSYERRDENGLPGWMGFESPAAESRHLHLGNMSLERRIEHFRGTPGVYCFAFETPMACAADLMSL